MFAIRAVRLFNRSDCCGNRLALVSIYADKMKCGGILSVAQGGSAGVLCHNRVANSITVKIDSDTPSYLTLCEVKVFGRHLADNIALSKPTSQSSVGFGGASSRV